MSEQSAQDQFDGVEITTGESPRVSVIWLHGLGADGHDFEPMVPELQLDGVLPVRFLFPHAPVRPVTLNGGIPMRAWFDLAGLDRQSAVDRAGLEESRTRVEALIAREQERGIAADHIVVAGFSQGGAVALHAGLRHEQRLAGLIGLSTFLPLAEELEREATAVNRELPIFMAHGEQDPVLPPQLGEASFRTLERLGYPVKWRTYPMPHAVCPQEIRHIRAWLLNL